MKKLTALSILVILLIITGCGFSQPSRFYRLSPASLKDIQLMEISSKKDTITVGPVTIPVVLNRPQIVSLTGNNSVTISEYDRWAGSLNDNLIITLTEDLSLLLPSRTVVPYELGRRLDSGYQIVLDVQQFDGIMGKNVILKVGWIVIKKDTKTPLLVKKTIIEQEVKGSGYEDFVTAMSNALIQLSKEIAGVLDQI
jgi:hypothetical protein